METRRLWCLLCTWRRMELAEVMNINYIFWGNFLQYCFINRWLNTYIIYVGYRFTHWMRWDHNKLSVSSLPICMVPHSGSTHAAVDILPPFLPSRTKAGWVCGPPFKHFHLCFSAHKWPRLRHCRVSTPARRLSSGRACTLVLFVRLFRFTTSQTLLLGGRFSFFFFCEMAHRSQRKLEARELFWPFVFFSWNCGKRLNRVSDQGAVSHSAGGPQSWGNPREGSKVSAASRHSHKGLPTWCCGAPRG